MMIGYLGLLAARRLHAGVGRVYFGLHQAIRSSRAVGGFGVLLLLWVIGWASSLDNQRFARVMAYLSIDDHLDSFSKGVLDSKDIVLLREHDHPRPVPDGPGHGIDPVEGVMADQKQPPRRNLRPSRCLTR